MEVFRDDDEGYRRWIAAHPEGYVVNTYRTPTAGYLMLHRAACRVGILPWQHRNPTRAYTKWCSLDRQELANHLQQVAGGSLSEASCCFR